MFNFEDVNLDRIVVHTVGNKMKEEVLTCSEEVLTIDDQLISGLLHKYFLSAFRSEEFYNFGHSGGFENNLVFKSVKRIFEDPECFFAESVVLAEHLFNQSSHPNIKSGEFYLVYFQDCVVEGEFADAVGIFKSENKDTFLKVYPQNRSFNIACDSGININKLDKGCLIFNTEQEMGYKVSVVDTVGKTNETARYWKDDFLGLVARKDDFYNTREFLNLCKGFVDERLTEEKSFDKIDKAEILNNTLSFFKEQDQFNERSFQETVIKNPKVIDEFEDYKNQYLEERGFDAMGEFQISEGAIKENKKLFKSVLKLDKNFHLYIHGNHDLIEKGYDEIRKMNYYKIFFLEEK